MNENPEMMAPQTENIPKKRNRVGLVVGAIVSLVAVGCIVAAVVVALTVKPVDMVQHAIAELMSGNIARNVVLGGRVTVIPSNMNEDFQSVEVDFQSRIITTEASNYTGASVTKILKDDRVQRYDVTEVQVKGGEVFMQIDGIGEEYSEFNGEWIHVPDKDINLVAKALPIEIPTQCILDVAGELGKHNDNIGKLYEANPFITYSTDKVRVAKKYGTIYRLGFDEPALAAFVNSLDSQEFVNSLRGCVGKSSSGDVTTGDIIDVLSNIPEIYVELDDQGRFVRVYLGLNVENYATFDVDMHIEYPTLLTIEEPANYIELDKASEEVVKALIPVAKPSTPEDTTAWTSN